MSAQLEHASAIPLAPGRPRAITALVREVLLLAAASIFLALTARISVTLPFTPVPVTGQTLGILLTGVLYGPRRGTLAVLAYLAEGLAGAPVFAGGTSGLPVLFGPTGGYLVGFVPAAALAGWLGRSGRPAWLRLAGIILATAVVYVCGVPWLAIVTGLGLGVAVAKGLVPFLAGDAIKAVLAAGVAPAGAQVLARILPHPSALPIASRSKAKRDQEPPSSFDRDYFDRLEKDRRAGAAQDGADGWGTLAKPEYYDQNTPEARQRVASGEQSAEIYDSERKKIDVYVAGRYVGSGSTPDEAAELMNQHRRRKGLPPKSS